MKLTIALAATLMACGAATPVDPGPAGFDQLLMFEGGGHAFLIDDGGPPLALTAHHVAGDFVPSIGPGPTLRSPVDSRISIRLGRRLEVPGARTIGTGSSQHDMAVFQVVDRDASRYLRLAAALPAVGDTVWVLAVHTGAAGAGRHPARVDIVHDSLVAYSYLASANTNGSSGAALLDRAGRVVGINVGTLIVDAGRWQRWRERYGPCCDQPVGGEVVGLAVGLPAIRHHLAAAR